MNKVFILAVAIGLISSLGAYGGRAAFTDQDTLTANDFDSGTIDLGLGTASALVTYTNMKPGDTTGTQSLVLTNNGTLSLDYTMSTTMVADTGTPLLGDALDLTIKTIDVTTPGTPCDDFDGTTLYAVDLNGGAIGSARTLASAASETLCFEVVFPSADTAPQGATADAEFVFDSTQT